MLLVERNSPFRSRNFCTRSSGGKKPIKEFYKVAESVLRRMIAKSNQMLHLMVKLFMDHIGPILLP